METNCFFQTTAHISQGMLPVVNPAFCCCPLQESQTFHWNNLHIWATLPPTCQTGFRGGLRWEFLRTQSSQVPGVCGCLRGTALVSARGRKAARAERVRCLLAGSLHSHSPTATSLAAQAAGLGKTEWKWWLLGKLTQEDICTYFFFFLQLHQKSSRAEPVNSQGSTPFEPAGITLTEVNPENLFAQSSAWIYIKTWCHYWKQLLSSSACISRGHKLTDCKREFR